MRALPVVSDSVPIVVDASMCCKNTASKKLHQIFTNPLVVVSLQRKAMLNVTEKH